MDDPAQDSSQLTQNPVSSLADAVEEFEEKQNDFQAAYNAGGHFKEQLEAISKEFRTEGREILAAKEKPVEKAHEVPVNPEVDLEVKDYLESVEKDTELQKALADDYIRQVGMTSANPARIQIKLPMTRDQIQQGLHHKIWESVRWLAEWCVRQIKILNSKPPGLQPPA